MDLSGQIKSLFKPQERPHPPNAELSVREGYGRAEKDFRWMETNVPCRKACPAGTDIPAYLTAIAEARYDEAYRINLRDNVFPGILGRICSRPCEAACRHGYAGLGEPVAICFSKRAAEEQADPKPVLLPAWYPPSGKHVAVVGSGVAGLTVARNLTLLGHRVTVYEKYARPGGMLNQAIPEFRLPRRIIDREIGQIAALGVEIICNTAIGTDLPLSRLLARFDAVVMAAGTLKPNLLNIPGQDLAGIRHGLDFLLEVNQTGKAEIGRRAIVIGGGFTAMDCARTARRLGTRIVQWDLKVLYRRSRDEMRITPGELEELEEEGIPLECHAIPCAYLGDRGQVTGMRFRNTQDDQIFDVPADTVLLATGQFPDTSWTGESDEPAASDPKLFAAGDYAQGSTSLIDAIAHAKETVDRVDAYLMGAARMRPVIHVEPAQATGRTLDMDQVERQSMPTLAVSERDLSGEVEQGYDPAAARVEAERCYRCNYKFEIDQDKCIKCDWCLKARPRPECILMLKTITHDDEGCVVSWESTDNVREMNLIWINADECIRCGECLKACPVDAINLQKVSLHAEPSCTEESPPNPEERP